MAYRFRQWINKERNVLAERTIAERSCFCIRAKLKAATHYATQPTGRGSAPIQITEIGVFKAGDSIGLGVDVDEEHGFLSRPRLGKQLPVGRGDAR